MQSKYGCSLKLLGLVLVVAVIFSASVGSISAAPRRAVSLATMPAGTSTYTVGAGLCSVWNKYCPFTVTQQPMQVTGPAFRLIKNGSLDLGLTTIWAINACYTGDDPFWDLWRMKDFAPCPITQLNTGSVMRYGFFTTNPNIKSIKDLEGKRVFCTQPGAENDVQVKALLKAAGSDYSKIIDVKFSQVSDATQGLLEGRAEAFYFTAAPWIEEIARTKKIYAVAIPPEVVAKANELLPGWGFTQEQLAKGEFGIQNAAQTLAVPFGFYARESLEEEIVYELVKTMYEHHDEAKQVHEGYLGPWTLERALMVIGAPIHPGAIRYYKEVGAWKPEHEKANNELLAANRRVK